jgi:hypothetical protein
MPLSLFKLRSVLTACGVSCCVSSRQLIIKTSAGVVIITPREPLLSELYAVYSKEYYRVSDMGYVYVRCSSWDHSFCFHCSSPAMLVMKLAKHKIVDLVAFDVRLLNQIVKERKTKIIKYEKIDSVLAEV